MVSDIVKCNSSHRAACKQWSAGLGVIILLVGGLAGLNSTKMLWAAGPLLLIGLVEAGYAAQERRYAEFLKAKKGNEEMAALLPEAASASVVRTTFAALSLSIWPFYLGLFAIVAVGGEQMAASNKKPMLANGSLYLTPTGMVRTAAANTGGGAGCGSGGCGSAAGCGSGACGASAGKGCSCGGGATTAPAQMPRQVQPYLQTANGPRPIQGGYPVPQPQFQGGYPQQMPQPQIISPQQASQFPQPAQMQPSQYPLQPQAQAQMPQRVPYSALVTARPPTVSSNPAPARTIPAPLQPPANATDPNSNAVPPLPPQASVAMPPPQPAASAPAAPAPASNPATPSPAKKKG